jgi:inward rectifier potassium channel
MALRKHINPKSILNNDTGFGSDPSRYGGRFVNKDGSYNIIRRGLKLQYRISIFQTLIAMPLWEFILAILLFFVLLNVCFACIYYVLGAGEFSTGPRTGLLLHMVHLFFFSVEALTTVSVDYLKVTPTGFWASIMSSVEALCGLIIFAILTGLVYGRFARPRSYLAFSRHALISPYQGKTGLMFRLVSYKDRHNLTDANIHVSLGLNVEEDGKPVYRFYSLQLERYHVDSLNMNWTIVHPIDEQSPLQNFTREDLEHGQAEIFVQVTGFDEVFSATVVRKTSYFHNEIIYGARFVPMYHESEDDTTTILELDKLNDYDPVDLPATS